ncbi:cobyrinic acid a,c-diamide synthase [Rhodomicrobium vannielii ATCC 17100]|uniref:Hydrogenobyrinate a,c-diamide synthase n=1 Tax=Rhodomicrobium vannielii (strain ATCC 17100 / DSM 162 / LMG 4299 / NCIMB 10020 / ATH 3.1.1) TaxID=648757 RepID=E3I5K8_RHOVT|nr:cobyrinate a,c-diamide synthase [Rhodomicrobium vannielii]ADP72819.1 cobyrinic acid a,c-diamide synthase [Rhodomicrobium vannielii ATCC 17100]
MTGGGKSGPRGVIISAVRSGAGKTTLSLGLMRALTRRGVAVQPFKSGPDYIDPAFHEAACGRPSFNLDTWAMPRELIGSLIGRAGASAASEMPLDRTLCIAEGVMGLFDGVAAEGRTARGATADLAALTGWPVVLVLDVSAQSETAAAVALGCKLYRDDVHLAGVILNRVASEGHERPIRAALERIGVPVLGALRRRASIALPDRHLGLVQAGEHADLDGWLDKLAEEVAAQVSLDAIVASAAPCVLEAAPSAPPLPPPGQRIALAKDRAFSFLYPHMLQGWRDAGAEILCFSPLADDAPDASADAVWLPGGYPELHAGTLAAASHFLGGLRDAAARGTNIHGECGGYMVLGSGLEDADGVRHAMAGLLGLETSFAKRKLHLGYRRAQLLADGALGRAGGTLWGHEFHYASVLAVNDAPLLDAVDARGEPCAETGSRRGLVSGSFFHAIAVEG